MLAAVGTCPFPPHPSLVSCASGGKGLGRVRSRVVQDVREDGTRLPFPSLVPTSTARALLYLQVYFQTDMNLWAGWRYALVLVTGPPLRHSFFFLSLCVCCMQRSHFPLK